MVLNKTSVFLFCFSPLVEIMIINYVASIRVAHTVILNQIKCNRFLGERIFVECVKNFISRENEWESENHVIIRAKWAWLPKIRPK